VNSLEAARVGGRLGQGVASFLLAGVDADLAAGR
jgi:hypothetical protein